MTQYAIRCAIMRVGVLHGNAPRMCGWLCISFIELERGVMVVLCRKPAVASTH